MVTTNAPPIRDLDPDIRDMDVETLIKLYPTKMEPMPEGLRQFRPLVMLAELLIRFFEMAERKVAIFSDSFIYYRDERGGISNVAPDLCVAFDVNLDALGEDRSYFVERMGKPPEFVMEIGSPSTAERDVKEKPRIYAHISASEYWLLDPEDGSIYGFPLMGLQLVGGEYEPIELTHLPNGRVRGYSAALGLILEWDDGNLRVIDPATGRRLRTPSELAVAERAARREASAARREASEERRRRELIEAELDELRRKLRDR